MGVRYIMENSEDDALLESVIGFDALYQSLMKCRKGVIWKDSVAHFYLNGIEQTMKLEEELKSGKYVPRPPKQFMITSPKPRPAVSIAFRDRVYQRSLNDNVIYPCMSKQFIADNLACQKGKGTQLACDRLEQFLHEVYRKYGRNAYVWQSDIHGYYRNMRHDVAEARFRANLPPEIYQRTESVLRDQYEGDVGYYAGSQMIQIAGISVLSPLDHMIKEKLRIKWYERYMDDFHAIHPDREYLEDCRAVTESALAEIGFEFHPKKTRIYPLSEGIIFLGFKFRLTDTGKVVKTVSPQNVKARRKKMFRLVALAKRGELPRSKVEECYKSWKAHAGEGNSERLIQRMDEYVKQLWR